MRPKAGRVGIGPVRPQRIEVDQVGWNSPSLDKGIARRVRHAVERFAATGAGSVKKLHGIHPPEYRLRVGDHRARFGLDGETIRIVRVRNRREAYR